MAGDEEDRPVLEDVLDEEPHDRRKAGVVGPDERVVQQERDSSRARPEVAEGREPREEVELLPRARRDGRRELGPREDPAPAGHEGHGQVLPEFQPLVGEAAGRHHPPRRLGEAPAKVAVGRGSSGSERLPGQVERVAEEEGPLQRRLRFGQRLLGFPGRLPALARPRRHLPFGGEAGLVGLALAGASLLGRPPRGFGGRGHHQILALDAEGREPFLYFLAQTRDPFGQGDDVAPHSGLEGGELHLEDLPPASGPRPSRLGHEQRLRKAEAGRNIQARESRPEAKLEGAQLPGLAVEDLPPEPQRLRTGREPLLGAVGVHELRQKGSRLVRSG